MKNILLPVFLSYSHIDFRIANQIYTKLKEICVNRGLSHTENVLMNFPSPIKFKYSPDTKIDEFKVLFEQSLFADDETIWSDELVFTMFSTVKSIGVVATNHIVNSEGVRREIEIAQNAKCKIYFFQIDKTKIPNEYLEFNNFEIINVSFNWHEEIQKIHKKVKEYEKQKEWEKMGRMASDAVFLIDIMPNRNNHELANYYIFMATADSMLGRISEAMKEFNIALKLINEKDDPLFVADTLYRMGCALVSGPNLSEKELHNQLVEAFEFMKLSLQIMLKHDLINLTTRQIPINKLENICRKNLEELWRKREKQ